MSVARRMCRLLIACAAALAAACAPDPTSPTPPPIVTPTPTAGTVDLKSFAASPPTITLGDSFTFEWEGHGGTVCLARKGESPFVVGLPSSGSRVMALGAAGYPRSEGAIVYEAMIGDVVVKREVTVAVNPVPTPTPEPPIVTLSSASIDSCHPTLSSGNITPCTIPFTATASHYTGLAWAGCCAGSSGTSGTCSVNAIQAFTCSVTATGPGGSATANATVTGVNTGPTQGAFAWLHNGVAVTTLPAGHSITDDAAIAFDVTDPDGDARQDMTCAVTGLSGCGWQGSCHVHSTYYLRLSFTVVTGATGTVCRFTVNVSDAWGTPGPSTSYSVNVH
jgi:hypothetical protein